MSALSSQMVDRLDEGLLPPEVGRTDYKGLYQVVAKALFRAHVEGQLKAEIINDPGTASESVRLGLLLDCKGLYQVVERPCSEQRSKDSSRARSPTTQVLILTAEILCVSTK